MLIFWFLNVVHAMLLWIIGLFPGASLTDLGWIGSVGEFFGFALRLNGTFPISEMVDAIGLYSVFYIGMHSGNAVRRVWSLFTGGGGA